MKCMLPLVHHISQLFGTGLILSGLGQNYRFIILGFIMVIVMTLHTHFGLISFGLNKSSQWLGFGWELTDSMLSQSGGGDHMSLGAKGYAGVATWV